MFKRSSVVVAGLVALASFAEAQGCTIDVDKPAQLFGAKIRVGKIADESDQSHIGEKPDHLRKTLVVLYEDTQKIDNQIGRYYLLGKAYSVWLKLDLKGWSAVVPRERIGLFPNPKGMHDMYASIDTAFSKVEALNPACEDSTSRYRQGVAAIVYNQANDALNDKKYDTSIVLARRALVVNPKGAAPWNVIAAAMQGKGDTAGYKQALRKVTESQEKDAAMVKVRATAYYNIAVLTLSQAAKKDGDERKSLASEAEKDLREFLKMKEGDAAGQAALSQALTMKGDTVEARKMMDEMLQHPEKFNSTTLFVAAGSQHSAGQYASAVRLYNEGLKKNPAFRDALFSLSVTYVTMGEFDAAVPIVARLIAVDPNNVNSQTSAWNVWRGIIKNGKTESYKATAADSSLKYSDLRTNGQLSVEMSPEFDTSNDSAVVEGVVQNRTAAAKSYAITFEMLNATGGVVASTTVAVPDVPAKTGKRFKVAVAGKGIVSWRYKPVQ